jgi:hypothetical protein
VDVGTPSPGYVLALDPAGASRNDLILSTFRSALRMKLDTTRVWRLAVSLVPLATMLLTLAATRRWG